MDLVLQGLDLVLQPSVLGLMLLGTLIGVVIGAVPGLGPVQIIPLLIPFTLFTSPAPAIIFLFATYIASIYGGSISAVLIKTPGTPASIATTFDGYPLTGQGKAGKALVVALVASVLGDLVATAVLIAMAEPVSNFALRFGPAEIASIIIFSLVLVSATVGDSLIKGLFAAGIGGLLGVVGADPVTGTQRFSFGVLELQNGIGLLPMLLGLFTISELIFLAGANFAASIERAHDIRKDRPENRTVSFQELWELRGALTRGSLVGVVLGILPGLGSSAAALLAYGWAKRASKSKETFGRGNLEGVAAPEAANNAETAGALLPFLTLGIPGNSVIAILGGAFILHGVIPGPLVFEKSGDIVYALYIGLVLINLVMLAVGMLAIRWVHLLSFVPINVLLAIVFCLSVTGVYAASNSAFDISLMFAFGVLGYLMRLVGVPPTPLLIAFLLTPMFEEASRQSLILSGGSVSIFFEKPISAILLAFTALWLVGSALLSRRRP